jgi:hypothetical protein
MIERRAQVRAINRGDRTRVANLRRYFTVAGFDLVAENLPRAIYQPKRTRFEIHTHPRLQQTEHLF